MNIQRLGTMIGLLAFAGLCLPTLGWAADANVLPAPQIGDVALRDGGVLVGQMVNGQNAPQSGIRVALQDTQNREVGAAVTDRQGSFAISGVQGGVYQIVTPQGRQIYRLWSPGIAPPSAQPGVLLITPDATVRGQLGDGVTHPMVVGALIGGTIATAIAVPVTYAIAHKSPSSP